MPVDKLSIQDFAQKIKEAHPEYKDVNDTILTQKIVEKYPQYKDRVNFDAAPSTTPVDKGIRQTDQNLNQPIQFNGTFKPDLEGEKNGLYLNDPDYQKQKQDFTNRIITDPKGNLLYPEKDDKTGQWLNHYTKQPLPNFDPQQMQGGILQVPHEYLAATGGKQFISPVYNKATNSYSFPGVDTPDVPHVQTMPGATVYGKSKGPATQPPKVSTDVQSILDESKKQGGQFDQVLKNNPQLASDIDNTLKKYGPEYKESLGSGSEAMTNVIQKSVEDKYNLTKPLPANVDPDILNSHLNVLNNFDKNRLQFESSQQDLQHQADLITDRAKRTGQPVSPEDGDALAKKSSDNIQKWENYKKSVQFSQNYVQQPQVQQYLNEFKKRQDGLQLIDQVKQRAFPTDVKAQMKQDEYDRKAIEGNTNAWDYVKTGLGKAFSGLSNMGETAMQATPGILSMGLVHMSPQGSGMVENLNNNAQRFLSSNLPAISPEGIDEMNKKGIGHMLNDVSSMAGSFAPYIIPGMAEEGLAQKGATFATALSESLPTVRKEAEKQGLTGSAYNTFVTLKPLVNAAFMTLLPNAKFAKGFDNDVAKAIVDGEFNNPKRMLMNLASKVTTVHPEDVAHLQAMLSGTALGDAVVNKVTNALQAGQDIQRGISRKEGLPVELSDAFNPRQTAVMALAGKVLETIPTLKNTIGDYAAGKETADTYNNIQNNILELAGHNLEGVSKKVDEMVKKDPGNVYAQHIKNTLQDYAYAEARMPEGLEPEQKAALFDIQKQISQKQRQMGNADPAYQPHIQKNVDELNKLIPDILKDPQKANDYLKDAHKDLEQSILSPQTENNEEAKTATNSQAKGQPGEMSENPTEGGGASEPTRAAPPSIQPESWARTLDYGNNKGKDETKESQDKIKEEILNDKPIGGNGEKFSQLLGRVIPGIQKVMQEDPHNTAIVTHSSVIKALNVWEEMGRPDISELKGDKLKEFAQRYIDLKPEAEGKVHTFKGDNGNDIKVIRHGETEDNVASEFREDDTQLTDKGKAQAEKAGQNLVRETGGNIPKIISSNLPRTLHTSDIISDVFSKNKEPEKPRVSVSTPNIVNVKLKENALPFIEEEGDNEFTSTKNAVTKQKIEDAGLQKPMEEAARDFGKVWKQAQDKLNKGFDIEDLLKTLNKKPHAVTDLENAMILFHQNVKESQLDAANKDLDKARKDNDREEWNDAYNRRAKLLDDLQDIYNVDKSIGRETARGLNARKMMADRRFSLVNMQLEKRASNGGEPLSDVQMTELKRQYEDIKQTKEALDKRVEELEKENARLSAGKEVSGEKKVTGRTKKTKEQFKQERKDIVQRMRDDLLKAAKGGEGLTSSIPLAAQLKAVAPHIKDLVKSFVEEGVDSLEDITKGIKDILKPSIPDIEDRHIHDLIAGEYNEPKTKKEGELSKEALLKQAAKAQKYRVNDPELMKAQADYERAKDKFAQGLKKDQLKSRTNFQKTQDAFVKYERAFKLSNPITLGKLAMAAITRMATTPIEEAVGAGYSAVLPGIAKKAPGEAGFHVKALAKGYKAAFMRGLDDAATVAKGGKTDIESIFGKKGELPPEALDFFGQLHSAIKAPVKRFAFERSFEKRMANNIKNGTPIDGMVEARIAMEAYKDAQRSIFMQDNLVSKGWTNMMASWEKNGSGGQAAATIGRWLIPFVKVPTNILGETISHVAGPEIALGKIIATSLGKGLENLSQEEAEMIMRNLKKGTIGNVALMAGYLNPKSFGGYYQKDEKRKPGDVKPGDLRIGGHDVPGWALEAPLFQAMQIGATIRRIKDTLVKGQAKKGIGEGIWGGAMGLLSHEPLLDEPSRLVSALTNPKERGYFFGELAKSTLIPAAVDYAAKVSDPDDKRSLARKMIEPENNRQPQTVMEHVESGIPGLREKVGEKKPIGGHKQRAPHR